MGDVISPSVNHVEYFTSWATFSLSYRLLTAWLVDAEIFFKNSSTGQISVVVTRLAQKLIANCTAAGG